MANGNHISKLSAMDNNSKGNNVVIILEDGIEKNTTFREYFEMYDGTNQVLPCGNIINWDDVVDNIKIKEIRDDAIASGCLFGTEYPPDTPIVRKIK